MLVALAATGHDTGLTTVSGRPSTTAEGEVGRHLVERHRVPDIEEIDAERSSGSRRNASIARASRGTRRTSRKNAPPMCPDKPAYQADPLGAPLAGGVCQRGGAGKESDSHTRRPTTA